MSESYQIYTPDQSADLQSRYSLAKDHLHLVDNGCPTNHLPGEIQRDLKQIKNNGCLLPKSEEQLVIDCLTDAAIDDFERVARLDYKTELKVNIKETIDQIRELQSKASENQTYLDQIVRNERTLELARNTKPEKVC